MTMEYTFTAPDGSEGKISAIELQNFMQSAGINAIVSPDGMTGTIIENGQEFEGPIRDIIERDYGKIKTIAPSQEATDYSTVDNTLKSGIAQFGSDSLKAKYLQIALENSGIPDAKIVGSGDDWYRYDPANGRYLALTNVPGAEISDVLTYAPEAARTVGSILGSAPGTLAALATAPTGVGVAGGLASAAAGGAIGGQIGKRGSALLQQVLDPNFDQTLKSLTEEEARAYAGDIVAEVVGDAAAGAIPYAGGKVVQNLFSKGALTQAGAFAARGMEAGSKATQQLAKMGTNSDLVRALSTQAAVPALGSAQAAGWIGQVPQWLATKGVGYAGKALEKLGATDAAEMIGRATSRTRGTLDPVERGVAGFRSFFTPQGIEQPFLRQQARDVLGNLGEEIGQRLYSKGIARAKDIADPFARQEELARLATQRANLPKMGEIFGRTLDSAGTLGRGLEQSVDKVAKGAFQAIEKGAGATSLGFRTARTALEAAGPLEGRAALKYGQSYAEENLPWRQ